MLVNYMQSDQATTEPPIQPPKGARKRVLKGGDLLFKVVLRTSLTVDILIFNVENKY